MTGVLLDIAVKTTVLFVAGAGADWLLRRASAAARHVLWTSVLSGALALPVLGLLLPGWRIPVRAGAVGAVLARVEAAPALGVAASSTALQAAGAPRTVSRWPDIALTLWLAGMVLCLARTVLSVVSAERLRRRAVPAPAALAARTRDARVLLVSGPAMPMTAGLLRPSIVLPEAALAWPEERLEAVLQHELAHVRRGDTLWQLLGSVVCAVFWPHPLAWHAHRKALRYREQAADDVVLSAGAAPQDYAGNLLEIARTLSAPRFCESAAMARPRELEGRLLAVLDEGRDRRPATRGVLAVSTAVTLTAVLGLAALKPAAAQQGDVSGLSVEQARARLVASEQAAGPQSAEFGRALVALGQALSLSGDEKTAASMFHRAVETLGQAAPRDAAFAEALYRSGVYAQDAADKALAERLYLQALDVARASGNRRVVARASRNLAVLTEKTDPAQAERYLQAAIENEPEQALLADTLERQAALLAGSGRTAEADAANQQAKLARARIVTTPDVKSGPDVHKIGGGISAPLVRTKTEPNYSAEARAAKLQGTVVLALEIGTDGLPRNVRVLRGTGLGLDESAARAVSGWRFDPAKDQSNQPVAVIAHVEVNFRLL